jgi:hypothetical protein
VFDSVVQTPEGIPAVKPKVALAKPTGLPEEFLTPEESAARRPSFVEVEPGQPAQPITWQDVRKLRSTLGDAISNPKVVNDLGQQNIKHLYAALTQDMGNVAGELGQTQAFNQANAGSKALYDFAEGPLAKIISDKKASLADPEPGKVAQALLNGGKVGDTTLQALRANGMDQPVNELAAAMLREKPDLWAKMSPEGKAALIPDPAHRQVIDSALQAQSMAPVGVKMAREAAQAAHEAHMESVEGMLSFGPESSAARVRGLQRQALESGAERTAQSVLLKQQRDQASREAEEANRAFEALPRNDAAERTLEAIRRSHVAAAAGALLGLGHHVLTGEAGISPELGLLAGGAGGELLAGLAGPLARGAQALARRPAKLANPLIGGEAGTLGGQ